MKKGTREDSKKRNTLKRILIPIISVFLALILVISGYLIYVISVYYRIEDNLVISVNNTNTNIVQVDTNYKVTSWNTGFASYSQDFSFFMDGGTYSRAYNKEEVYKNMNGIINSLKAINSDFTLLQEVDIDSTRSYNINEKDYYLSNFSVNNTFALNYDSPYLFWPLLSPHGKSVSGLLSMSNFKIDSALRRSLPIDNGFSKFLDLDRCYTKNVLPTSNGKNLVLYNVHLSAYSSNESMVTKQVEILVNDMKEEYLKGNYTICGGDFNKDLLGDSGSIFGVSGKDYTWAKAFPTTVLPEEITLIANHDANVPSCRNCDTGYQEGKTFVITIDGFLISDNVDFVSYNVQDLEFMNSDHNPVTMEFNLRG